MSERPVTQPTDSDVMCRVRDGELGELATLFERHHRRLYNYCARLLGSREAGEDLAQEVFVRLLKYRHTYRDGQPFLPWVYTMARNACFDQLRKHSRETADELADEPPASGPLPLEKLELREEVHRMTRALDALPVDKRELLVAARFGGLGYQEIAEGLGCTVGALKVRVHRAVKQLREIYDTLGSEAAS